jgi:hypothetical protein
VDDIVVVISVVENIFVSDVVAVPDVASVDVV